MSTADSLNSLQFHVELAKSAAERHIDNLMEMDATHSVLGDRPAADEAAEYRINHRSRWDSAQTEIVATRSTPKDLRDEDFYQVRAAVAAHGASYARRRGLAVAPYYQEGEE